jgi:hypothetical protein
VAGIVLAETARRRAPDAPTAQLPEGVAPG